MSKHWPLRTTGITDIREAVDRTVAGDQNFMWFHFDNPQKKGLWSDVCRNNKLVILSHGVPCWFLLACRRDVPIATRERMVRSLLVGLMKDDVVWRGEQFGYGREEIDWYLNEVEQAWKGFEAHYGSQ